MRHAGLDVWMLIHGREGQANAQSSFICNGLNQKAAKRLWTNDMGGTALEHTIPHLYFNGKSSWLYRNERHLFTRTSQRGKQINEHQDGQLGKV